MQSAEQWRLRLTAYAYMAPITTVSEHHTVLSVFIHTAPSEVQKCYCPHFTDGELMLSDLPKVTQEVFGKAGD